MRPEQLLMLAVLEDALRSWRHLQEGKPSLRASRRRRELEQWFASDAADWPCSFLNVCHAIGLEGSYVRTRLHLPGRRLAQRRSAALPPDVVQAMLLASRAPRDRVAARLLGHP